MYLDTSWLTGYIFKCARVNHEIFRNQRHILKCVTIPMMLTNPLKSNFSRFDDHEFKIKVVKNDGVTLEFQFHFHWNHFKKFTWDYFPYHMWGLGEGHACAWDKDDRLEEGGGGRRGLIMSSDGGLKIRFHQFHNDYLRRSEFSGEFLRGAHKFPDFSRRISVRIKILRGQINLGT